MVRLVRQLTVIAVVAILAFGVVAQPAHAQNQVHIVRRGETLSSIAARYGTTTQAIVRANGLPNPNYIYAGQRLVIPGAGSSGAASSGGASQMALADYTVRRGDTLTSIASRHGTTVAAIMQANSLRSSLIYVGQRLAISGAGSSGAASSGAQASLARARPIPFAAVILCLALPPGTALPSPPSCRPTACAPASSMPGSGSPFPVLAAAVLLTAAAQQAVGQARRLGPDLYRSPRRYPVWHCRPGTAPPSPPSCRPIGLRSSYHLCGTAARAAWRWRSSSGTANSGAASGGGKRIVIDLSAQRMYVYQNGQLLWNWVVSTGRPGQATAVGHYKVLNKIPNAYAYTWNLQMPYWLGIYWAGSLQNGIHALPIQANGQRLWAGYLGQRVSFGCIILGTQNAKTLYNWATVGIPVDIVW